MTTLRTFQNEIHEIQARQAHKEKQDRSSGTPAGPSTTTNTVPAAMNPSIDRNGMPEIEDAILAALQSEVPTDRDSARDLVSSLITHSAGEYIFRLGKQPPQESIFSGNIPEEPPDNDSTTKSWTGTPRSVEEIATLISRLTALADEIGGKASLLFNKAGWSPRATLLLRLPPPSVSLTPEVRCAVVGNVDSGKSTTLGVLTRGVLDDGRGRSRVGLFRHKHEIETGRTSSVGMEILGFAPSGEPILPKSSGSVDPDVVKREKLGWDEITTQAAKIISFADLAGHERYLKTTLYGLTSGAPSCVILTVGANAGLIGMSKEHLAIALALNVPVVVCITKIDMTPLNVINETVKQVVKILKSPGCRKIPVFVNSIEQSVELASLLGRDRICPIFKLSNVTGAGLDYLRTFLNLLPSSEADLERFSPDLPLDFAITDIWSVPYVGVVVNGLVNSGKVHTGDAVMVGPDANGNYFTSMVKSIQRKRADVTSADAGQCVSLALKRCKRNQVRKGMVLVHKSDSPPRPIRRFKGSVLILYHNTTLQKNYQAMLHSGPIRQTVRIVEMDHPQGVLRTGDRAVVTFEFISRPEHIKEGMKLLFREGKTKGLGVVTQLL